MPAELHRLRSPCGEHLVAEIEAPTRIGCWVVFAHGFGSSRHAIKAEALAGRLRRLGAGFVRFDFRGHGDSEGAAESLTLSRQIADLEVVRAALDERDPDAPVVGVGSSLGGLTLAWYSALHRNRIESQVLIAPAFRAAERLLACLDSDERSAWRRSGLHRFERDGEHYALRWDVIEESRQYPFEQLLADSSTPTWIVHGTDDPQVPLELSERFVAEADQTQPSLDAIEGGDHGLHQHTPRIWTAVKAAIETAVRQPSNSR